MTLFCEADVCTKSNYFRDVAKQLGYTMGDAMKMYLCLCRLLRECEAEGAKKADGAMSAPLHTTNTKDTGGNEKGNDSSDDID